MAKSTPAAAPTIKRRPAPTECVRCAALPAVKDGSRPAPVPVLQKSTDTQATHVCPDCGFAHVVAHVRKGA